jgi:phosphate-selective porin
MKKWVLVFTVAIVTLWAITAVADPESVGKKSSEERLLDILLDRNIITAAEYEELAGITMEPEATPNLRRSDFESTVRELVDQHGSDDDAHVGYRKGFAIETSDGMFSLKLGARIQGRYTFYDFDSDSDESDRGEFSVPRSRLIFSGHAFDPNVRYKLQVDFSERTDDGGTALKDGWIEWGNPEYFYAVRAGQYKAPFGRQELTSSGDLQFVDRTLVSDRFTPGRQVGAEVHGETEGGFFQYAAGMFNGDGEDVMMNDVNGYMFVGRVAFNPMGAFSLYEGDPDYTEDLGLSFGANYLYNPLGTDAGDAIFGEPTKAKVNSVGLDAQMRFMGFSLLGEYFWREVSEDSSGVDLDDINDTGFYLQGGYFLIPETFEVAGRYGWFNVENDNNDEDDDTTEWGIALSYYFEKHNHKIQFDFTRVDFDPDSGDDTADNIFRLQWQLKF